MNRESYEYQMRVARARARWEQEQARKRLKRLAAKQADVRPFPAWWEPERPDVKLATGMTECPHYYLDTVAQWRVPGPEWIEVVW